MARILRNAGALALTAAMPGAAFAHTGHDAVFSLAAGFLHPISGLDHVLAMVAVGFLASQMGGRARAILPLTFVCVMALGAAAGFAGFNLPYVELGIAASIVLLGVLIATGAEPPVALAAGMAGVFAVFHGHAHGAETPVAGAFGFAGGFLAATLLLHLAGLGLGAAAQRISPALSPRVIRIGGGSLMSAGLVLAYAAS